MSLCDCGRPYYPDSTGEGPCHFRCECGDLIDADDNSIASEFGRCNDCFIEALESDRVVFGHVIEKLEKLVPESGKELVDVIKQFNKKRGLA